MSKQFDFKQFSLVKPHILVLFDPDKTLKYINHFRWLIGPKSVVMSIWCVFNSICFDDVGLLSADIAKCQATRPD